VEIATARHAVNAAALARDRVALVGTVAWLPVTMAFSYERHRARAFANALEGSGDAALAELNLGALSLPPSAAVRAADAAALQLLLGDPARAITTLSVAARSDPGFDDFGRDVLLAAIREAPSEWRRAAGTAVLARHPRAAVVAAGAAVDSLGDLHGYRVGLATAGLATALVALLALPAVFIDGAAPDRGVTAPSYAAPPSVVVVPERALRPLRPPDRAEPTAPTSQPSATLVSATPQPGRFALQNRHPARPTFARPAPVAPVPKPTPAPTPGPPAAPVPAPQPAAALAVASATPAPAITEPKPKNKGKAKGHAKRAEKAAAPQPAAPAPAPETEPAAASEPPGHEKQDDKDKDKDKKDKQK
jgi:hypothetical protein